MSRLKLWQSSVGILLFILYWALIAACGASIGPWPDTALTVVRIVAFVVMAVGAVVFAIGFLSSSPTRRQTTSRRTPPADGEHVKDDFPSDEDNSHRGEIVFVGFGLVLLGLVALIASAWFDDRVPVTPELKFAVGVGGVALGGFVFAATQFDTIRAAASVPVVLLLIGVATWPGAADLMEPSVREALIKWMGILLGVNGVAEAGKQVGETFARSRGTREVTGTAGDLTSTE
ncbi:membrane hypothetical protein [metagenome]|uniref:Uncharacterized protein n=1 Tax=metagenome TaxID=256318 RepID=A0A2P2C3V3_9ZZZZ